MKKIITFLFALIFINNINAQCPSVTVTPLSKTLTCNGAAVNYTAVFTPTANVTGVWWGPGNTVVSVSNTSPLVLSTSNPGTYTFTATDNASSCTTSQTVVAVRSNSTIPTMTVVSAASGFTLNCFKPCLPMSILSSGTLAPTTYTWTNLTTSVSTSPLNGSYTICVPGQYRAQFADGNFCLVNQIITVQIDTLKPTPLSNTSLPGNSYTLNCYTPTLIATAFSTPSLSASSYSWVSPPSLTINSNSINVSLVNISSSVSPTNYTVLAQGANGCIGKAIVPFSKDIAVPSMAVAPISQTLTCNGACKSFTASTAFNPNVFGTWYDQSGNPMTPASGPPLIICAGAPGTYLATYTNTTNGCTVSQTVNVTSNISVPTISVTSVLGGFVTNCTKPCLPMNINSSGTIAPTSYTWTNLTTSVSTFPFNGGYTVCTTGANTPGSYEAAFMDGNFCKVTTTINITIDTIRPSPFSSTNLTSSSFTINCFTPSLVATALTNPMYSPASYSWTAPPNLIISSNTISIGMGNIPGSSVIYTVSAIGPNGCVGKQKVFFYKDVFVPPYGITFSPSAITCTTPCVAMSPTSASTVPITFTFTSPPPTTTATVAGALFCIPGTYTMTYMNSNNGCIGITNTVVPVNSPCGVNEINLNDQISIAPNPNNGKFSVLINVNIENAEIKIVNAIGQEVYRQNIKQGKNDVNAGVLAKGIYYYNISQNKIPVSKGKLVIE